VLILPVRSLAGVLAIDDDNVPERVYVTVARPRVARREDGTSRLRLIRWAPTTGRAESPAIGGRLTLDIDVSPTAEEIAAASLSSRTVLPMPWLDGRIRLEGPQFEAVEADAVLSPGMVSAVSVDLSADAAALLAPLLQMNAVSPLQVTWTGHVLVRLPAVEVMATADVSEIRRRIEIAGANTQTIITRSIIDANARIEIRGADNAALEQALRQWVLDQLTTNFAQGKSLTVRAAASEVVHWPIQLATTLDDFVPAASRHSLVDTTLLDGAAIGVTPPIEVRVLADFSGPLERVDIRLEAGTQSETVSCTDDTAQYVGLDTLDFRWSDRLKLKGRSDADWTAWSDAHGSSHLLIPIFVPSTLSIDVLASGLDFTNRWASVQVVLTHDVPGATPTSDTVELSASCTSTTWTRAIDGIRGSVTVRMVYLSRQGPSIELPAVPVANDQIVVTDPLEHHQVRLSLVPAGTGWQDVALAMVDLRYVDGAYTMEEAIELRTLNDFVDWSAPARPDGPQSIQWRMHTSFTDGRFQSTDWQTAPDDVLVLRLEGKAQRQVQVLPIYFDPAATKQGTLRLHSGSQSETVVITDQTERHVTLAPGPFTWTLAWTTADGRDLADSVEHDGEDVIVVPRFQQA
jgi:hypothetical protein